MVGYYTGRVVLGVSQVFPIRRLMPPHTHLTILFRFSFPTMLWYIKCGGERKSCTRGWYAHTYVRVYTMYKSSCLQRLCRVSCASCAHFRSFRVGRLHYYCRSIFFNAPFR